MIPKIIEEKRKQRIVVKFKPENKKLLEEKSKEWGITQTNLLELAFEEFIKEKK